MKHLRLLAIIFCGMVLMSASDCENRDRKTADSEQQRQTEQALSEAQKQIGMPAIVNYQERKLFKQILELRDQESLITYCYLVNELNGEVGQFLGKGIGFGIPAATQFTNPNKVLDPDQIPGQSYYSGEGTPVVIPQADPNGLFMPTSTSATWYMLLDAKGNPHPVYIEPLIIVSPFKLH